MTKMQIIETAIDALAAAKADLIDTATGAFKPQPDVSDDLRLGAAIESAYVNNGGTISPDVSKIIGGVTAILQITGV